MADIGKIDLSIKDVMQHMTLRVRMPRSFTIRTRIACWLIGMAGRVMDVPCEMEMHRDDSGRHKGRMGDAYQPAPSMPTTPPPPKPKG